MSKKLPNIPATLILVDGSSFLYRAFYAMPPLTAPDNVPTGAIYGVVNMVMKLIDYYKPVLMAVIFDAPEPTFRHRLYPQYKAQRPAMPEDLVCQIAPVQAIINDLGIPVIVMPGTEADDIMATLACTAAAAGQEVLIASSDKDLAQIVTHNIHMVNTMNNDHYSPAFIQHKFGVPPNLMVDYLALIGDKVDNIPHVPGVGPKTAAKLLAEYGSIDGLLAQVGHISGKLGAVLHAAREQILLARTLVRLDTALALPLTWDNLARRQLDHVAVRAWAQKLAFNSWLKTIPAVTGAEPLPCNDGALLVNNDQEIIINTAADLAQWCTAVGLAQANTLFVHLLIEQGRPQGLYLALQAEERAYLPWQALLSIWPKLPAATGLLAALANSQLTKVWHDMKAQLNVLQAALSWHAVGNFDVQLAAYVIDNSLGDYTLPNLLLRYANAQVAQHPLRDLAAVYQQLSLKIAADPAAQAVLAKIDMPLAGVLAQMERHGVLLDLTKLAAQTASLRTHLTNLAVAAYQIAGKTFNLNSPQQITQILFTELNLPVQRKTAKGQASTADDVLQELAVHYELPRIISEYRMISKLVSTYTSKLPQLVEHKSQRVHTLYNQTATVTSRLSSVHPNLQNIPIRTPLGKQIRQAFIAPPGHQLVTADYSQIELRIMAHMAADEHLIAAFRQGLDIHRITAAEVLGIAPAAVSAVERNNAKAINFGLIYGISAFGLARQLKIAQAEAQHYIDRYFARYPQILSYMATTKEQAAQQGYVTTIWGRKLYIRDINSNNALQRKAAQRLAINAPIQGSAADLIKLAMLALMPQLAEYHVQMIMQVHDELVFEVPDAVVSEFMALLRTSMTNVVSLEVPLVVSVGAGADWDLAHDHSS